jgi:hypothetical protein
MILQSINLANPVSDDASTAKTILGEELDRFEVAFNELGIGFSVSQARREWWHGTARKPPYLSCRYDAGDMSNVNVVTFYYSLLGDWEFLHEDSEAYRRRIRSAMREELIHAVQIIKVKEKYEQSFWARCRYKTAETFYEHLLDRIVDELSFTNEGQSAVLTAAQLYYEDWTITSMDRLKETDKALYGRDGYFVIELIRQLVQIQFGELTSEEAKGEAWDRHRVFNVEKFGTSGTLLRSMSTALRHAVPRMIQLSPALAEVLNEVEGAIRKIDESLLNRWDYFGLKACEPELYSR